MKADDFTMQNSAFALINLLWTTNPFYKKAFILSSGRLRLCGAGSEDLKQQGSLLGKGNSVCGKSGTA